MKFLQDNNLEAGNVLLDEHFYPQNSNFLYPCDQNSIIFHYHIKLKKSFQTLNIVKKQMFICLQI